MGGINKGSLYGHQALLPTGSFVLAAAAAMGADPRPDSLEKSSSRHTILDSHPNAGRPTKPPTAAAGLKAEVKTSGQCDWDFASIKRE